MHTIQNGFVLVTLGHVSEIERIDADRGMDMIHISITYFGGAHQTHTVTPKEFRGLVDAYRDYVEHRSYD